MSAKMDDERPALANKPGGSRFKQQKLPAWKPVLTAKCVIPLFFAFGVVFIPVGVVLLLESNTIKEKVINYSSCTQEDGLECSNFRKDNRTFEAMSENCTCNYNFSLTEDWGGTVYFYYRLTEFYQNHRRYLKSVHQKQLQGSPSDTSTCTPNAFKSEGGLPILPCGMIANSMFNDSFRLSSVVRAGQSNESTVPISWNRSRIAWAEDLKYKFNNPSSFDGTSRPAFWQKSVQDLPGMMENEDLAVWMRTAALPKFRKLYAHYSSGLTRGNYSLAVDFNYPVRRGEKHFVLSTVGWIGGKSDFLAYAYLAVGGLSLLSGGVLLLIYLVCGQRKQDVKDLR